MNKEKKNIENYEKGCEYRKSRGGGWSRDSDFLHSWRQPSWASWFRINYLGFRLVLQEKKKQ